MFLPCLVSNIEDMQVPAHNRRITTLWVLKYKMIKFNLDFSAKITGIYTKSLLGGTLESLYFFINHFSMFVLIKIIRTK